MKTILITGGSGSLGSSTCKLFLQKGWKIVSLDRKEPPELSTINNYHFIKTDLLDESSAAVSIDEAIRQFGPIKAAALIAGGFAVGSLENSCAEEFTKMINLNFFTSLNAARPLIKHMNSQDLGGRIALIGGKPGLEASSASWAAGYGISKSLVFKLSEYINHVGAETDIVSAVIVPSIMDTPTNRQSMPKADPSDWVTTEQVAETILFFCSEQGRALRDPVFKVYGNS